MSEQNGSNGNGLYPGGEPIRLPAKRVCGSKLRNKDAFCQSTFLYPNGRCKLHGGASAKGPGSGSYKHGRYSKYLPEDLRQKFEAAISDPELTHLRSELGLIDAILEEKIERIHAGESGAVLSSALTLIEDYEKATSGESADGYNGPEPREILDAVKAVLVRGRATLNLFEEVQPIVEQRRKLAESENKRLAQVAKSLSVEEAMLFVRQLGDSIKRNVSDPKEKAAVFADFERIVA